MNESTRSTTGAAVTHRFVTGAHPIVQPLAYTHFLRYQKSRRGQYTHKRTECTKKKPKCKEFAVEFILSRLWHATGRFCVGPKADCAALEDRSKTGVCVN